MKTQITLVAFVLSCFCIAVSASDDHHGPAQLEKIPGTNYKMIRLTEKAITRLDIKTATIKKSESGEILAPYAALTYGTDGKTYVHTSPKPRSFVRHEVHVLRISGEHAILKEGPPEGTSVVVTGVSELYGAEKGVGH